MEVTAERQGGASVTVSYDFGDDLNSLTEKFSAEVVFSHARRSFVVALQSFVRTQIEAGKSAEEIQALVNEWKPGQRKAGKSPGERVHDMLQRMDPAARAALLKEYRAKEKEARAA
jgi:hypothetical protein